MSDYLPPGCTDEMTDGYNPTCQYCGCEWSAHYDEVNENFSLNDLMRRDGNMDYYQVEFNVKGEVVHACDSVINVKTREQCDCKRFEE